MSLLEQKLQGHPLKAWICGQEKHADGSLHLHILLQFVRAPDFKNPRCFDIAGFHPNIRKVGAGVQDRFNVTEYCMKVLFWSAPRCLLFLSNGVIIGWKLYLAGDRALPKQQGLSQEESRSRCLVRSGSQQGQARRPVSNSLPGEAQSGAHNQQRQAKAHMDYRAARSGQDDVGGVDFRFCQCLSSCGGCSVSFRQLSAGANHSLRRQHAEVRGNCGREQLLPITNQHPGASEVQHQAVEGETTSAHDRPDQPHARVWQAYGGGGVSVQVHPSPGGGLVVRSRDGYAGVWRGGFTAVFSRSVGGQMLLM